ncbi:MAG: ABC transporter transmembrane domain-containing protein, partial [Pseudomonadota bacterium]
MSGLKRLFAGAPPALAPSGPASALDAAVRAPIPDPRAPDPDASPAGRTAAPEPRDVDTLDADAPTRASGDARMPILRALLADGALAEARLDGPWVEALLALLEGHGRLPEPAALAQALPHLPDRLDEDVFLGICARLGLKGSEIVAPARQIDPAKLPGLLPPVRRGETLRMIRAAEDGRLTVTALDGGDAAPAPAGTLRALVFEQAATDEGLAPPPGVSWLRALAARFAPEAGLLLALGFALNLLLAVVSLSIMVIYDSVLPTRAYDTLAYLAAGAAGALLFEAALRRRRAKLAGRLAARVENLLAASLFAKLMTLPADQVTDIPVSDQISRLRRFEALRDFSAGPFVSVVLETPLIIPLCVVLALIGGPIAFAPVGVAVLCGGAAAMSLGPLRRATAVAALRQTEQTNLTLDAVTNIERIRDLGCADVFGKRLDAAAVHMDIMGGSTAE